MITILIKAAQLILSLSILVIIHELGHYTFARIFRTRVEKFYLFFDPWFSIWKHKKGDTEYGIGWLPLGGYVKISGMVDESMDKEQMSNPPQPWEFRSKPAWQRLCIMIGGVLFNFLLAMIIYASILFVWGDTYIPNENLKDGVVCSTLAESIGFENGDKIISIDGKSVVRFESVMLSLILDHPKEVRIERGRMEKTISLSEKDLNDIVSERNTPFFYPRMANLMIDSVRPNSPAFIAGIRANDQIRMINGSEMMYRDQVSNQLNKYPSQEISITILRDNAPLTFMVNMGDSARLGIFYPNLDSVFQRTDQYSFITSIPVGAKKGIDGMVNYVKQLKLVFVAKGMTKELGGFVSIGKIFPSQWVWQQFWNLTAFLSIVLGIMNILPIPALDGGHVMFVLYEMITGRKPKEKILEYATIVGMILLFSLLLFANGNDFFKLFHK